MSSIFPTVSMDIDPNLLGACAAAASATAGASASASISSISTPTLMGQSNEGNQDAVSSRNIYGFSRKTVEKWHVEKEQELKAIQDKMAELAPKKADLEKQKNKVYKSIQTTQEILSKFALKEQQNRAQLGVTQEAGRKIQLRLQSSAESIKEVGSDIKKLEEHSLAVQTEVEALKENEAAKESLEKAYTHCLEEKSVFISSEAHLTQHHQSLLDELLGLDGMLQEYNDKAKGIRLEATNLKSLLREERQCQEYALSATPLANIPKDSMPLNIQIPTPASSKDAYPLLHTPSLPLFAAAASASTPLELGPEKKVGKKRRHTSGQLENNEPIGLESEPNIPNQARFPSDSLQGQFMKQDLTVKQLQDLISNPQNHAALDLSLDGYTPFHVLLLTGNVSLIRAFIDFKPAAYQLPTELHGGWTPLHLLSFLSAINESSQEDVSYLIRYFIEQRISIVKLNPEGYNCVHLAAHNGNEKALKALIQYQSPQNNFINVKSQYGYSPLHYAAFCDERSVFVIRELLTCKDLDVNILSDVFGRTALMVSSYGEDLGAVQLLIPRVIETDGLNIVDNQGNTALDYNLSIGNRLNKLSTQKEKNAITLLFRSKGATQGDISGHQERSVAKRAKSVAKSVDAKSVDKEPPQEEERKDSDMS